MFAKTPIACTVLLLATSCLSKKFLECLENEDVRVVRHRLEEEKEKRLLAQNDVEVLMLKVAQLERALFDQGKNKCQKTPAELTNTVAVHAAHSNAHVNLAVGQILILDIVIANQGHGYSPVTGIFRASIPGTYLFTLHLLSFTSITLHNGILKNDVQVGSTYAPPGNTGSQSLIIDLVMGDEVYVKAYVKGGAHGGNYCTFTGFMIH